MVWTCRRNRCQRDGGDPVSSRFSTLACNGFRFGFMSTLTGMDGPPLAPVDSWKQREHSRWSCSPSRERGRCWLLLPTVTAALSIQSYCTTFCETCQLAVVSQLAGLYACYNMIQARKPVVFLSPVWAGHSVWFSVTRQSTIHQKTPLRDCGNSLSIQRSQLDARTNSDDKYSGGCFRRSDDLPFSQRYWP
jgi:hypothetical protein